MNEIKALLDHYQKWLRDRTSIREINEWTEVTTPFVDRHNDHLQIFVKPENGNYVLSDDGYILNDLEISGCGLTTPKRKELLKVTLNGFGIEIHDDILQVKATTENFPQKKHNLIQAMLAVNDLFFTAQSTVANLFFEDVMVWLDTSDIRYVPRVKLTGNSGFDHVFDFVIPKSRKQPERLLRAISTPNRDRAESFAFAWLDTANSRQAGSKAYAIINDNEKSLQQGVKEALDAYNINAVLWSQRELIKEEMVA